MDFGTLYSDEKRKTRNSGTSRKRMFCIFLAITAVTALVIWALIPSSKKELPPSAAENNGETAAPAVQKETSAPEQAETGKKSVPREIAGADKMPQSPDPELPEEKEKAIAEKRNSGSTADFPKGIAGAGDVAAKDDKPLIPTEKNTFDFETEYKQLEQLAAGKKLSAAANGAGVLLGKLTFGSEPYRKTLALLTGINRTRFVEKDTQNEFAKVHTVSAGEYLGKIARKYNTTVAAIMKSNKLKNSNIMVGQKITVLPGKWLVRVSKSSRLLLLMRNDTIFMGFDVGVGRFGRTPSADFVVADRLKNPVYRTSDGRIFKHGEKGNELGNYFLKLSASGNPGRPLLGYGIHGTPNERSVSRSLSNGCIRMRNADVENLYLLLPAGTRVEIRN